MDMEKRERKPPVVGRQQLARRHAIGSGSTSSTSSPPTAAAAAGCNGKDRKGGEHKAALREKKLKAKAFKWRSSNGDMKSKVEEGGSDQADAVLCSLSRASFSGLVSWKRVRTLGKVAERCDTVDPPVPRKLRSAINKRAGKFASGSPRHVKKRRHLSAISAQISFVDQETRPNGTSLFTEEEEALADALLSLSQVPFHSELTADKVIADSSNTNVASTSYSKGPTKEGDQTVVLPSSANELAKQSVCIDKVVKQTNIVPTANPVSCTTDQSSNKTPPLSATEQIPDLSMGTAVNLPSPSKDTSENSTQKQPQFDDSKCHPAQKPEAPLWLVNSNKSDGTPHEREKATNNGAQEIVPLVQTLLPCTPAGYLIKPSSSKLAARANTISEPTNFTAPGNHNKHPLVKNVSTPKAWKRSITHVYVSHVIQMHVNKEKAVASVVSHSQAKPAEERPLACLSRPPNGGPATSHKATAMARDEKFYTVHFDVRVPPHQQPSAGICDVGAGRQKIVSGGSWQNLPPTAVSALPATAQHVQYLHHQMAQGPPPPPRDATSYPFPHLPYSRGSLAPTVALQQMPQQYVCSPGYGPRAAASSAMMMKQLQQLMPTTQQQQMWQYHFSQYQPRPEATPSPAAAVAAWQGISSSLRPMGMLAPPAMPSTTPRPPQMELLCAPYQGGGRQPQQLRLM